MLTPSAEAGVLAAIARILAAAKIALFRRILMFPSPRTLLKF